MNPDPSPAPPQQPVPPAAPGTPSVCRRGPADLRHWLGGVHWPRAGSRTDPPAGNAARSTPGRGNRIGKSRTVPCIPSRQAGTAPPRRPNPWPHPSNRSGQPRLIGGILQELRLEHVHAVAPAGLAPAGAFSFRWGRYLSSRRRAFGADDDGVSSSATGQKTAVPDGRSHSRRL